MGPTLYGHVIISTSSSTLSLVSCYVLLAMSSIQVIVCDRFGEPQECAGAVAFLVSEDASYMTGETVVVAGGMQAHL